MRTKPVVAITLRVLRPVARVCVLGTLRGVRSIACFPTEVERRRVSGCQYDKWIYFSFIIFFPRHNYDNDTAATITIALFCKNFYYICIVLSQLNTLL